MELRQDGLMARLSGRIFRYFYIFWHKTCDISLKTLVLDRIKGLGQKENSIASFYEIPGGLVWVKNNLKVIIGNQPLEQIMDFGDTWRSRGHTPLLHVISPAMDNVRM